MEGLSYEFTTALWLYEGPGGWTFASLPVAVSAEIKAHVGRGRGFGSVRVTVTIGASSWQTSIFPDNKAGTYLLPVKAAVRKAEGVEAGDSTTIQIQIAF